MYYDVSACVKNKSELSQQVVHDQTGTESNINMDSERDETFIQPWPCLFLRREIHTPMIIMSSNTSTEYFSPPSSEWEGCGTFPYDQHDLRVTLLGSSIIVATLASHARYANMWHRRTCERTRKIKRNENQMRWCDGDFINGTKKSSCTSMTRLWRYIQNLI